MEMNVRRSPPSARLIPVVLDPHDRPRPFPTPGRVGPEPDHGGRHSQVVELRVHLDDVPSPEEECGAVRIIVRTSQSEAR